MKKNEENTFKKYIKGHSLAQLAIIQQTTKYKTRKRRTDRRNE